MKHHYYLGLDMGTNSVGWAVTDENYHLLRAKGKDLWGIREFDEALPAADRRSYRVSRRRLQRRKVKIGFLKDYFHDAVCHEDPSFYARLENSKYHLKDKDEAVAQKYGIFHDRGYTDVDYYREYPTIFHLRKALMDSSFEHGNQYARLVFLALLNMFKHRGHFLASSLSDENGAGSVPDLYRNFRETILDKTDLSFPETFDMEQFQEILASRDYSRTQKAEQIGELLAIPRTDKQKTEFIKALCGLTADTAKLFPDKSEDSETEKPPKFSFTDAGYEEKLPDVISYIGNDYSEILEKYCTKDLNLIEPRICIDKIKLQSLLNINSYDAYLSGKTGNQLILKNAVQLCLNQAHINYIHKVEHGSCC